MKYIFVFNVSVISLLFTNFSHAQISSYCTGPVIIMEAEGEVESIPDTAEVTIDITSENETASIALQDLANNIDSVVNILKREGINDQDIRTDTVNIYPTYSNGHMYPMEEDSTIVSYNSTSFIYFKTTDIENIKELLNQVMKESDNLFSNIEYSSSNEEELMIKAREIAYKKAHSKAKHYAELSGNKLGSICTITEGDIEDVTDIYGQIAAARSFGVMRQVSLSSPEADIPNIQIKPGTVQTKTKVSVIYQLEN